jgi:hypothetical protein
MYFGSHVFCRRRTPKSRSALQSQLYQRLHDGNLSYAICKTYGRLGFLAGCSATASLAMVIRHGFSCIQPSAIRLFSVPLGSTIRVKLRGEDDDEGGPLLAQALTRFPSPGKSSRVASAYSPLGSDQASSTA